MPRFLTVLATLLPAVALAAPGASAPDVDQTGIHAAPAQSSGVDHVPGDFATIQDAIDNGSAPVIEVAAGTWEGARITRKVAIRGTEASIDSGVKAGSINVGFALDGKSSGSAISGFTFSCDSKSLDGGVFSSAKRFGSAADGVNISGNTFQGCLQGVSNVGNDIDECGSEGVDGGAYWVVEDNTFDGFSTRSDRGQTGGGMGVFLFNAHGADVMNNTFKGAVDDSSSFTTSGVFLAGCIDCTVALNKFKVRGGNHYWSAVSNFGFYQPGAAASARVVMSDNDASEDSAPHRGVSFRSYDSFAVDFDQNTGTRYVDHTMCGDEDKQGG